MTVGQTNTDDQIAYENKLANIRKRRRFLWGVIFVYVPASVAMAQYVDSYKWLGILFSCWLILLCIAVALLAASKCPRCGETFHMRNSTLSFFAKCCHCGFHLKEAA